MRHVDGGRRARVAGDLGGLGGIGAESLDAFGERRLRDLVFVAILSKVSKRNNPIILLFELAGIVYG
jgi:hypothetical protein